MPAEQQQSYIDNRSVPEEAESDEEGGEQEMDLEPNPDLVESSHEDDLPQMIVDQRQELLDDIGAEEWDIGNYLTDYRGNDEIDQVISDVVEEIKLLKKLSKDIFDSIGKIENIYDIESLRYKLGSVDRLLSSRRDGTYKLRDYTLRHFHSDKNTFRTVMFRKQYNEPRNFIENVYPRLEQVIKRL